MCNAHEFELIMNNCLQVERAVKQAIDVVFADGSSESEPSQLQAGACWSLAAVNPVPSAKYLLNNIC